MKTPVAIAQGDGIGPEIMSATLEVLNASGAPLEYKYISVGEKTYREGYSSGIKPDSWDILRSCKALLKAPITTPQGGGYKSLNVTIRKSLGLFANVRPCRTYMPFISSRANPFDVVIVRENEEDLYAGIEYQQTKDTVHCLKLISRSGSERIIRYAFEYAKRHGRKKVTCLSKDNIMKLTDGLFHKIFDEVRKDYPDIISDHLIVDIGTARLAVVPDRFDVVVTLNLYGDIISDVVAETSGSVGLAPSANIGPTISMFEAVHGSAPDIAGKGIANPSGLLLSSVLMLVQLGFTKEAQSIQNAWLCAIEDGIHTTDIFKESISKKLVSTGEFARAVIERLGRSPSQFSPVEYSSVASTQVTEAPKTPTTKIEKKLVGVDVYIDSTGLTPSEIATQLKESESKQLKLTLITSRGLKVWPDGMKETGTVDLFRCRFMGAENAVTHASISELLSGLAASKVDFVKTESLFEFDGVKGYSLGQGE